MNEFDIRHIQQMAGTSSRIQALFDGVTSHITSLVSKIDDQEFKFSKYGAINNMVDKYIAENTRALKIISESGVDNSWQTANAKNDALFQKVKGSKIAEAEAKKIKDQTDFSLKSFKAREINGISTTDRIVREQAAFKSQIELAINKTLANGKGVQIGSEVKRLLNNTDELYAKAAQGATRSFTYLSSKVSGSAVKNIDRLIANEIQKAYRESDWIRMQEQPFIYGYFVKPSRGIGVCPMCTFLSGTYPKDFYFSNWHVSCRCHCEPLIDLRGTTKPPAIPANFKKWLSDNQEKLKVANTLPDFIYKNNLLKDSLRDFTTDNGIMQNIYHGINAGLDTEKLYSINGIYTEERRALHDKIIRHFTDQEGTKEGKVYMLGGASANGKSTLTESGFLPHPKKSIVVDPDAIKAMIPEYNKMLYDTNPAVRKETANFTHEESSYLGKRIQEDLKRQGKDYVLDGVNDGEYQKLEKKIGLIKEGGISIRADYCTLDTELSVKLAEARGIKTGRVIPSDVILDYNRDVSLLVPEIVKTGVIDEFYLWDTNINGKPRLILSQINGALKIEDQALYERFLKKGKL